MPLYRYTALDKSGKSKKGLMEASGEGEAKERIRSSGLMLVSIETKAKISSRQNLKGDELLAFTMQVAQLLQAGIPLYESLLTLEEQYRDSPSHRVVLSLCERIKAGESLSNAMKAFSQSFNDLYISMVASGESIGKVGIVMEKLFNLLQKQQRLKKQIFSAMIYPALLGGFCLLVVGLLLSFVIPSMKSFFEGQQLPGFTLMVIGASDFLNNWWYLIIAFVVAICFAIVSFIRKNRKAFDRLVMQTPLIRTVKVQAAMARFCRTMSTLLDGGLTLIEALRASQGVLLSSRLEEDLARVEEQIIEGGSLSSSISRIDWMPKVASRMMAVGEETGRLPLMMHRVADIYEEEVNKSSERLLTFLQPVILIIMGSVIALIMASVLVPLTTINLETFG